MVTLNPIKRVREAEERLENRATDVPVTSRYHTVEVATWNAVERELNYWSAYGWHLHTLRDGIRGTGIDMGYRLLLERDA